MKHCGCLLGGGGWVLLYLAGWLVGWLVGWSNNCSMDFVSSELKSLAGRKHEVQTQGKGP